MSLVVFVDNHDRREAGARRPHCASRTDDDVDTFSGATILGDGGVALILDIANLVATGRSQEAQLRATA